MLIPTACGSHPYAIKINMIFTACKRSLGQGNIFAPVCHSVHRGGRGSTWTGTPSGTSGRYPPAGTHPPGRYTPFVTGINQHLGHLSLAVGGSSQTSMNGID